MGAEKSFKKRTVEGGGCEKMFAGADITGGCQRNWGIRATDVGIEQNNT